MPIQLTFDSRNFAVSTWSGRVTSQEVRDGIMRDLKEVARARPPAYLVDLRAVEDWDVDTPDLVSTVEAMEEFVELFREMPVAIIAENDEPFGMSRMFEMRLAASLPTRMSVFRSYEDACSWAERERE